MHALIRRTPVASLKKSIVVLGTIAAIALSASAPGCSRAAGGPDLSLPAYRLESYGFNPSSTVESRITAPPRFLLEHLMKMDGRKNYKARALTPAERRTVMSYYGSLPPLNRKIIRERVVGIYFIDNFLGSGLADFIVGPGREVYAYLAINPSVMDRSLSDWMTYREKTCFKPDGKSYDIRVDCGTRYTGLMYILLHETTHIVDYVEGVTPYTEEGLKKVRPVTSDETAFTRGIWRAYDRPREDFPFRKGLTFYGMNKGPLLKMSECDKTYNGFSLSPFVSLYGSQNWAEDLAEYLTFYHLTEKLGQDYVIRVYRDGMAPREKSQRAGDSTKELLRTAREMRPMTRDAVRNREGHILRFYRIPPQGGSR